MEIARSNELYKPFSTPNNNFPSLYNTGIDKIPKNTDKNLSVNSPVPNTLIQKCKII